MNAKHHPWLMVFVIIGMWYGAGASAQHSQPDPMPSMAELEAICRSAPCRRNMTAQLRLRDGRIQEETAALYRAAITGTSVSVMAGEEIEVVAEFDDTQFLHWREVRRRESARTPVLTIALSQGNDGSMAAAISNRGRDPVKVELFLRAPGSHQFEYTSTCPIISGGTVYEYWDDPVVEVQVRTARVITDDAALMCD